MAWQNEMTIIIRHIIDDLDPTAYQFSDDRIEEAILVAAQLIHNEMEFAVDYTNHFKVKNSHDTIYRKGHIYKDNFN